MKCIRRNGWKFLLDFALLVLLALMYNKRALGLDFHEIGGFALYGLFVVHKLLNGKWIRAVTAGLFSLRTPARQKAFWVLDILLFASFTVILVTGILISKVVFPGGSGGAFVKAAHYAAAALALALAGVHLGLHFAWVGRQMGFLKKLPLVIRRMLAVILSVAVLAFGVVQIVSTSFYGWIRNYIILAVAETFPAQESDGADDAAVSVTETHAGTASETESGHGNGKGQGLRDGLGPHGNGNGNGGGEPVSVGGAATTLLNFASILLAFALVTAWLDGGIWVIKRRRLLKACRRRNLAAS